MSTKNDLDGHQKYYSLACHRFGNRKSKGKNILHAKPSKKAGCKAKINVVVSNKGSFVISNVHLEHNHQLSPTKARYLKCNRTIDLNVKKRLEVNDEAGISLNKNF